MTARSPKGWGAGIRDRSPFASHSFGRVRAIRKETIVMMVDSDAMDRIEIEQDETQKWLDQVRYSVRQDEEAAREFAVEQDWTGFGLVVLADGHAFSIPARSYHTDGHLCDHVIRSWNAHMAMLIMREETGDRDVVADFEGLLAYDAGNVKARETAVFISGWLSEHVILGESRVDGAGREFHEYETDAWVEMFADVYKVPNDLDQEKSIMAAFLDAAYEVSGSYCGECGTPDIDEVAALTDYRQCVDCSTWLETGVESPVCLECVEVGECSECVGLAVEGYRHNNIVAVTDAERDALIASCECAEL